MFITAKHTHEQWGSKSQCVIFQIKIKFDHIGIKTTFK